MALQPLNTVGAPLGQFDGLDTEVLTLKGGEVCSFTAVALSGSDKTAADGKDGGVGTNRTVVTKTLTAGMKQLYLADDGIAGYGTYFGTVTGGTAGQLTTGAVLGPHTATGSGKVTLWGQPGLYSVTLDAVDTTASTGLTTTNGTLAAGAALYATSAGLLTPNAAAAFDAGANATIVATFVEFTPEPGRVRSQGYQVTGTNSPTGDVSNVIAKSMTRATIWFKGN